MKKPKAIILAGGDGVRMRPLTYEVPKPLIPVAGKPVIEYAIENLREAGVREIIIAIGHLGEKIKEALGDGRKFGVKLLYSEEQKSLGSAGAIRNAASYLQKKPFVVINGDILTEFSISELIAFHDEEKYTASMALSTKPSTQGYGVALLRGERIINFMKEDTHQMTQLVNAGIYVINYSTFDLIPSSGKGALEDIFVILSKEGKLAGFPFEKPWFEVSTHQNYEKAIKQWKKASKDSVTK